MNPIVPLTDEAKKHQKRLKFLLIADLINMAFLLFAAPFMGMLEIMNCLILCCSYRQAHFCYLFMYMIFVAMDLVQLVCGVGLTI
jgi:hypothetical protein